MKLVEPEAWNAALDRALEERAVDMVFAASIPTAFSDDVPCILDSMSSRGDPEAVDVTELQALYILSMVARTGDPFGFNNFWAKRMGNFVVGAEGRTFCASGRGRRNAMVRLLDELAAAPQVDV